MSQLTVKKFERASSEAMAGRSILPRQNQALLNNSIDRKMTTEERSARHKKYLIQQHAAHFLQVMAEAFGLKFVDEKHSYENRLISLTNHWENICRVSELSIEPLLKWCYANLFATVMEQELTPPPPGCSIPCVSKMFCGSLYRFVKQLLHSVKRKGLRKRAEKAQTLLMIKKGSPLPDDDAVAKSVSKHYKALTDHKKGSRHIDLYVEADSLDETVEQVENIFDDAKILMSISNVVEEVFRGQRFCTEDAGKVIAFPSIRGHYENSAKNGGAAGLLSKTWLECGSENQLYKMTYHPHMGVREVRQNLTSHSEHYTETLRCEIMSPGYTVCARPVFIKESLKIRPVTTGAVSGYHAMMPLQKFLFRTLQRFPTFRLIGEPVTGSLLDSLLDLKIVKDHPEWSWLSGDYTAATDNLRKCLSDHCLREIGRVASIPQDYLQLALKCLTGHFLDYGKVGQHLPPGAPTFVEQGNGQLMGSPLSFPILCLINAALCKLSYEEGQGTCWADFETVRLRDLPLLINGDDCVMYFNSEMRSAWYRLTAVAGLDPSVGKCYWAPNWLQINSEFLYLEDGRFVLSPFINFGLLKDFSSKGGEKRNWTDLESLHDKFIERFDGDRKVELSAMFRRCQSDLIATAPRGICWSFPQHLGGLGIALPNSDFPPCHRAKQLASYLIAKTIRTRRTASAFKREDLSVPHWVRQGLRDASKHSVIINVPTLGDLFRPVEREIDVNGECPYGKKLAPVDYAPWLWNAMKYSVTNEELDRTAEKGKCPASLRQSRKCRKEWTISWNASGEMSPFPLAVLRSYVPTPSTIPGGLSDCFASLCSPRGLISSVCARSSCGAEPFDPSQATSHLDGAYITPRNRSLLHITQRFAARGNFLEFG